MADLKSEISSQAIDVGRLLLLPSLPFETRSFDSKFYNALMVDFRHVNGATVQSSETEIAGFASENINFANQFPGRRDNSNRAFSVSSDVEIAVDIAPHSVEAEIVKLLQEAFVRQITILRDAKRPHIFLIALVHVQRAAIRADFNAIGRAHVRRKQVS